MFEIKLGLFLTHTETMSQRQWHRVQSVYLPVTLIVLMSRIPEDKEKLGATKRTREDNTKMDRKEMGCECGVDSNK
jgi:hypothetical protein